MANSCCPGKDSAPPAVPTVTACPRDGLVRNAVCLPSSCQRRTWQLVTCQESHQPSSGTPKQCEPVSRQPTHLPDMSCVGFVCQPIGSGTACCRPGTDHSTRAVSSSPLPCSDSAGGEAQNSCQEPACAVRPCLEAKPCQPSCPDTTSCAEASCPRVPSAAGPCQPTCCQGPSGHSPGGEAQPCGATYYQPLGFVFEPCQAVPCIPVSCQPLPCVFSPACWVPSLCQACHCQPVSPISFVCPPVATCQSTCSVKSPCKPVSCGTEHSGQPTCEAPPSHGCGHRSPSCQPTCCVTGSGNASSCGTCQPLCDCARHTPALALA